MKNQPSGRHWSNQFRIIGGRWRSRKFSFLAKTAVRPTTDRIRETLFNWLQNDIKGARCLDLFAGTGALGLEALSRGASEVVFVEKDQRLAQCIEEHLQQLECQQATVIKGDAEHAINDLTHRFDVVFLDPPFADQKLPRLCKLMGSRDLLSPGTLVYIEQSASAEHLALPGVWRWRNNKTTGQVRYSLIEVTSRSDQST